MRSAPPRPPSVSPNPATGTYRRRLRNLLIDARLQLKYSGMLVLVAVAISGILGTILWRTSRELVSQSQRVVEETCKVNEVVKTRIVDDPIYGQSPELLAAFSNAAADSERAVIAQQAALERKQTMMLVSLVGGLAAMVLLIGALGIVFTHRVAGPLHKMKAMLRQVIAGRLVWDGRLRKHDELHDLFADLAAMVASIRERQAKGAAELEVALAHAERNGVSAESIARMRALRIEMERAFER